MDTVDVTRRLRAARVLADLTVAELAAKLDTPGFGAKTLGAIERGERAVRPHEVRLLADALEVPDEFFTEPLGEGAAGDGAGNDDLSGRIARLEEIALENQQLLLALANAAGITEQSAPARALREVEAWRERKHAADRRASQSAPAKRRRATG